MSEEKRLRSKQILICAVAGGSAGIVTDILYFPLDSIKTRLQASDKRDNYTEKAKNISKMKGILPILMVSFPAAFTFFATYEKSKDLGLMIFPNKDDPRTHFLSAAMAETASNAVRYS